VTMRKPSCAFIPSVISQGVTVAARRSNRRQIVPHGVLPLFALAGHTEGITHLCPKGDGYHLPVARTKQVQHLTHLLLPALLLLRRSH
jgi:hypothetical protein